MRFLYAAAALFASLALAQQNAISIPEGQSTLEVTAGESTTIQWTDPSPGTVTVKLQQAGSNITPGSGITLASGIPASDGTLTFTVDPDQVNSFQYTVEIIDDTDPSNINFSPNFGVVGAQSTNTDNASLASSTGSVTSTATDSTATDSTATDSTATSDSTITSSASTESSSTSESASTTESSSTESEEESSTESAAATESTSAPSSTDNGAAGLKVQGGLVAALAVAVAIL